jgi:hypothetical protein
MICEHLRPLRDELLEAGIPEQLAYPPPKGQPQEPGRTWYFECVLQTDALRRRFDLPDFVVDEGHWGTHGGGELGFHCEPDDSRVLGHHPHYRAVRKVPTYR